MTAFLHGKARAHVMQFDDSARLWRSICPHFATTLDPAEPQYSESGNDWPLRHVSNPDTPRLVPWCGWCVDVIRRQLHRLAEDVLEPAEREL